MAPAGPPTGSNKPHTNPSSLLRLSSAAPRQPRNNSITESTCRWGGGASHQETSPPRLLRLLVPVSGAPPVPPPLLCLLSLSPPPLSSVVCAISQHHRITIQHAASRHQKSQSRTTRKARAERNKPRNKPGNERGPLFPSPGDIMVSFPKRFYLARPPSSGGREGALFFADDEVSLPLHITTHQSAHLLTQVSPLLDPCPDDIDLHKTEPLFLPPLAYLLPPHPMVVALCGGVGWGGWRSPPPHTHTHTFISSLLLSRRPLASHEQSVCCCAQGGMMMIAEGQYHILSQQSVSATNIAEGISFPSLSLSLPPRDLTR